MLAEDGSVEGDWRETSVAGSRSGNGEALQASNASGLPNGLGYGSGYCNRTLVMQVGQSNYVCHKTTKDAFKYR